MSIRSLVTVLSVYIVIGYRVAYQARWHRDKLIHIKQHYKKNIKNRLLSFWHTNKRGHHTPPPYEITAEEGD